MCYLISSAAVPREKGGSEPFNCRVPTMHSFVCGLRMISPGMLLTSHPGSRGNGEIKAERAYEPDDWHAVVTPLKRTVPQALTLSDVNGAIIWWWFLWG